MKTLLAIPTFLLAGLGLQAPVSAHAATIDVGDHFLIPGRSGQVVEIRVQGVSPNDDFQGLNFNLQVADAGPAEGGVIVGPAITAVDLTGPGTAFAGNNTGQREDPLNTPQLFITTTTTNEGSVLADGVLARVTLDTTGFQVGDGPWAFSLADTLNGPTDFAGIPIAINDGRLLLRSIDLPGDYNNDRVVDAADYSVWRDNLGAPAGTLPNDADGGEISTAQFRTWRARYGSSATAAAALPTPEPQGGALAAFSALGAIYCNRTPREAHR